MTVKILCEQNCFKVKDSLWVSGPLFSSSTYCFMVRTDLEWAVRYALTPGDASCIELPCCSLSLEYFSHMYKKYVSICCTLWKKYFSCFTYWHVFSAMRSYVWQVVLYLLVPWVLIVMILRQRVWPQYSQVTFLFSLNLNSFDLWWYRSDGAGHSPKKQRLTAHLLKLKFYRALRLLLETGRE